MKQFTPLAKIIKTVSHIFTEAVCMYTWLGWQLFQSLPVAGYIWWDRQQSICSNKTPVSEPHYLCPVMPVEDGLAKGWKRSHFCPHGKTPSSDSRRIVQTNKNLLTRIKTLHVIFSKGLTSKAKMDLLWMKILILPFCIQWVATALTHLQYSLGWIVLPHI